MQQILGRVYDTIRMSLKINATKSRIVLDSRNRMNNLKLYVKGEKRPKQRGSLSWLTKKKEMDRKFLKNQILV